MLLIVLSIFLCIFAAAILLLTFRTGISERLNLKVAALARKPEPPPAGEALADIRRKKQSLDAIPWLTPWLNGTNLASRCGLFLQQAGVTQALRSLLLIAVVGSASLGFLVYLRFGSAFPALLAAAGFIPLPFFYVQRKRRRRLFKLEQQLPDALGAISSSLRVGHSLAASMGSVAQEFKDPIAAEIRKCVEEQNFGIDFRVSLTNLTDRVPTQDFRIFAAAVLIQRESGGSLAELLEKLAQTTRERFRLKKQISVHTAQGRMTGWILTFFPAVLGLALYAVNPGGMSVLWTSSIGQKILYGAVGMDIVGALIIRKIVQIRV